MTNETNYGPYGIDIDHLLDHVIVPILGRLHMDSIPARILVLGTALTESRVRALRQYGSGPALGIYQMEPATHDDIWNNYLPYQKEMLECVRILLPRSYDSAAREMIGNLFYATAMCRVHYYRVKDALPTSLEGFAQYWKTHYNTDAGKGTVLDAWPHFDIATKAV